MSPQLVAVLAAVAASQARIAGMQAANAHWSALGQSPAYDEQSFFHEASRLDQLSIEARNCSQ